MSFDPGFDSMRSAGIPATRAPYAGTGAQQIRMSLEAMAQKMREGRIDAGVRGWALQCLKDHGLDGRDRHTTPFKQAAALLECLRAATVYAPDPYGVELVPGAAATLCVRPGLCLNGDDCDGLTVAYGALCMSIGLPVQIVKQSFGSDQQEHVLCVVFDGDEWQYADPSTNLPLGSAVSATDEIWIDPMGPVGPLPEAQPEIVTLGKPASHAAPPPPPPRATNTVPHWPAPVGAGSVLGYPTITDLLALTNSAAYNLQQLQAAAASCTAWPSDPAGYTAWTASLTKLEADFNGVVTYVNLYIGDQPKALYDWSVVFYPWDQVRAIIDREVELDRKFRANASCTAPVYPNEPQPPALDPDLWAYNASGSALKKIRNVAENVINPVTIGIVGIMTGIGVTIGGALLLEHFLGPLPRRSR